jgi:predicted NUDIX family phosphoesterase
MDKALFASRDTVETDSAYKQLIPYILFKCGDRYFSYARSKMSGESRLVGKRSIGVGGHVDRVDGGDQANAYYAGLFREMQEELSYRTPAGVPPIIAVVSDCSDEVGTVHLGIVHLVEVEREDLFSLEDKLWEPMFCSLAELQRDSALYENWSAMIIAWLVSQEKDVSHAEVQD